MAVAAQHRTAGQVLETLDVAAWDGAFSSNFAASALAALEGGKVLYFPALAFALSESEQRFLSPEIVEPGAKNVAYDPKKNTLKHAAATPAEAGDLAMLMARYSAHARGLVAALAPPYAQALAFGRTSFRPAEISGRAASRRKDDTLLHVDAFPASPLGAQRILRLFTNINPNGEARAWRLGEPFDKVARTFAPRAERQMPGGAWLQEKLGLTKGRRTAYDHLMLAIHDGMKLDRAYQDALAPVDFAFPPGSSWLVFTDQVSHAAMAGQYVLEQTFYLPVSAMSDQEKSPLHTLQHLTGRALV